MRTLVLNASYEPLTTVGWRRSVALVLNHKADVLHEYDKDIKSATGSMKCPSVIRLREFKKVPFRKHLVVNRKGILARDDNTCQFSHCDRRGTTMDHVIPRSKGGPHAWDNVVAACRPCNFKKADRSMRDMGWKLKRHPKAPSGRFLVLNGDIHPDWDQYLNNW